VAVTREAVFVVAEVEAPVIPVVSVVPMSQIVCMPLFSEEGACGWDATLEGTCETSGAWRQAARLPAVSKAVKKPASRFIPI
jgi:hypothetical protein